MKHIFHTLLSTILTIILIAFPQVACAVGWTELINTKLNNPAVWPSPVPPGSIEGVLTAWNGGIADTKRNRLIIWGGGHNDYYGNELYSVNAGTSPPTFTRLNNPTLPNPNVNSGSCGTEALPDGKPNSRHTYGGLAYIQHLDKMFVFGGCVASPVGCALTGTWTFDFTTLTWTRHSPSGTIPNGDFDIVAAYDPNTRKVFVSDTTYLYSYTYETNTFQRLSPWSGRDYHLNGTIDTKRNLFIMIGGDTNPNGILVHDISPGSNYAMQNWTSQTTGCSAILTANSPGVSYDSNIDRMVIWPNSGNTVYLFDPATKACTSKTFSGGPGSVGGNINGTFGRLQYFPALQQHVLMTSDWTKNAYMLKFNLPKSPAGIGVN